MYESQHPAFFSAPVVQAGFKPIEHLLRRRGQRGINHAFCQGHTALSNCIVLVGLVIQHLGHVMAVVSVSEARQWMWCDHANRASTANQEMLGSLTL